MNRVLAEAVKNIKIAAEEISEPLFSLKSKSGERLNKTIFWTTKYITPLSKFFVASIETIQCLL